MRGFVGGCCVEESGGGGDGTAWGGNRESVKLVWSVGAGEGCFAVWCVLW